ncbi:MAG TPA: arylamine N-acetyltransferase [Steroidobacteraceae bacterium]|nr:arylamine N-acetyltransferase [Steroidobacteraceae bacterium]
MNVDAYLRRTGYAGPREPTRAMLGELVQRHAQAIAFENVDAFLGRRVSLDPVDVERKLVREGRGGWCFEQNLLFGEVLRELGFKATDLAGRVLWNRPSDAITPRTHRLLKVEADGREWLVDVGFGGHTLTGVLDLYSEAAQATPHEPFRLRRLHGEERVLESLLGGEWKPLCRFDLQPQLPIDFEAANYQLAHDPASLFTQLLVVSRVAPDGRHVLRGRELASHRLGGETTRRELASTGEVLAALRELFGLKLDMATEAALRGRLGA